MKLLDLLHANALSRPDRIVWEDEYAEYSLSRIEKQSARIYTWLKNRGFGREDTILLRMQRSARIYIAMLGVWKAGGAFCVIGDHSPEDYVQQVLEDFEGSPVFDDSCFEKAMLCLPTEGYEAAAAENLAFIVYSTGSSGIFKGCMHEYGALDMAVERTITYFMPDSKTVRFYESLRLASKTTAYTISAIICIIDTLCLNYYIYLMPQAALTDMCLFDSLIIQKNINAYTGSPAEIQRLRCINAPIQNYTMTYEPALQNEIEGIPLANYYGMSESLCILTFFTADRHYDIMPAGKPLPDIAMKVIDSNGCQLPDGQIGEITFSSRYFRGYRNRPELTAEHLRSGWFRTGDMGYINEDGNYVILGRKIDMLQTPEGLIVPQLIRVQVEKLFPDITQSYVKVSGTANAPVVCVYYCGSKTYTVQELRQALKEQLPEWSLPTHCMQLADFARFPSGKINRLAFPEPV